MNKNDLVVETKHLPVVLAGHRSYRCELHSNSKIRITIEAGKNGIANFFFKLFLSLLVC